MEKFSTLDLVQVDFVLFAIFFQNFPEYSELFIKHVISSERKKCYHHAAKRESRKHDTTQSMTQSSALFLCVFFFLLGSACVRDIPKSFP